MKKLTILFAAVALLAMTACNEKHQPANSTDSAKKPATTEQKAPEANDTVKPKVNVDRPKPTSDGKDKVVAEFADAKGSQVKLVNNADGSIHLMLWEKGQDKDGAPKYDVLSKNCAMDKENYLMQCEDGKMCVVKLQTGAEEVTIMSGNQILYASKQK